MKSFKKFVTEMVGPHAMGYQFDSNDMLSALSNPVVLQKLNAFVGKITNEETKIVEDAISNLRQKLMRVGLSFGAVPMFEGKSGSFSLPLTLFGGRFGKDTDTPFDEFLNDDGISDKIEGGLSLNIGYEMTEANCYKITAKIE
tara:strand:- start:17879 stop:18307 length:429 start_codon:yes stop_codon:yes gene_type:complete